MGKDKIELIKKILSLCEFSRIDTFLQSYIERNLINEESVNCNANTFNFIIKKYNVNKREFCKTLARFDDSNDYHNSLEYHFSRVNNIGNVNKKKNKNEEIVEYIRAPQSKDIHLLYSKYIPNDNLAAFSTICEIQFLYKIEFIIKYLNSYIKSTTLDIFSWNEPNVKKELYSLDKASLIQLLSLLNNNTYDTFFNKDEDVYEDIYTKFLDKANITDLLLLHKNLEWIIKEIDTIEFLFCELQHCTNADLNNILCHLRSKPTLLTTSQTIDISYPEINTVINEHEFRYHTIALALRDLDNTTSDKIAWCFLNMCSTKWSILASIFNHYKNPAGKSVFTMINKIVTK